MNTLVKPLLETFGTAGLIAVIFAETGLLIGFFLPGDSLLIIAGVLAATHKKTSSLPDVKLNLAIILVGCAVAAIAGAQTGYLIGRKLGPTLFRRPDSKFFKHENVERAQGYFERFGPAKTIVLARFVPVVRTFANVVAGVLQMDARSFALWNAIGGTVWTVGMIMIGYSIGNIAGIDKYLILVIGAIIVISVIPVVLEVLKARRERKASREAA